MNEINILDNYILSIDAISALMYVKHISLRQMSKILGINSSRLHAMFKYKDEEHNRLLRIACTWVLTTQDMIDNIVVPESLIIREALS